MFSNLPEIRRFGETNKYARGAIDGGFEVKPLSENLRKGKRPKNR
jgi:hypothetical protein